MDRALQERVIGAIVLVVVAVLIVPVFLDGTANETEVIVQGVTLPGQGARQQETQRVVLNRDRSEPVPVNAPAPATDSTPEPARNEVPAVERPAAATTEAATGETAAAAESTTGMWAVQLGSFSSQENAERLAANLRNDGYLATLSKVDHASGTRHRVRVGPQKDRDSAESIATQLGRSGYDGQVVPHP